MCLGQRGSRCCYRMKKHLLSCAQVKMGWKELNRSGFNSELQARWQPREQHSQTSHTTRWTPFPNSEVFAPQEGTEKARESPPKISHAPFCTWP